MRWSQPQSARVVTRRERIPSNVKFINETQQEDGSYLSSIYPPGKFRKKGFQPIQIRVIEYTIENISR